VFLSRYRAVAIASLIPSALLLPSLALGRGGGEHSGGHSSSHSSSSSSHSSSSHSASKSSSSGSSVHVHDYTKKDGTHVEAHERSKPDGNFSNNWSTKGNVNPVTGKEGTRVTPASGHNEFGGSTNFPSSRSFTSGATGSRGALPSARVSSSTIESGSISTQGASPRAFTEERATPPVEAASAAGGATEHLQTVVAPPRSNVAPQDAASARFASKLANARALIRAGVLQPARKYLTEIIEGARGTSIAAEAQRELDTLSR
jgi:hypothetical protein